MKIKPREKKFIFVGGIVVAAVAVFYLMTLFLPNPGDLANEVEIKKEMLRKQRETLSGEESYREKLEQYTRRLQESRTRLLAGDNPNVAEADLQKLLMSFADRSGAEINRKNTLPDKKVGEDIVKVSISIELACDLEQLVRFLTEIQNHDRFLKIEQLTITGFQNQRRQQQQIRPSLTVVGYISTKQAPDTASATAGASAVADATSRTEPTASIVEPAYGTE